MFWHQTNARKFSSIAHYTVHGCMKLPRGSIGARYLRMLVAFLSSGIMHLLGDLAAGVQLRDSGAMRFFLAQALGMIIEDVAIRAYRRLPPGTKIPLVAEKGLGFLWVAIFLTWSVPAYMYPMMWRANQGLNDSTIPFSFFGPGAERIKAVGCLLSAGVVSLSGILIT